MIRKALPRVLSTRPTILCPTSLDQAESWGTLVRRLEIGASAHKAGFEPSTAYKKIQDCCETVWSDGHLVERKLSHLLQNSYYIHYRLS